MSERSVLKQLLFMDERSAVRAIDAGFKEYARFISSIYNDIYDSCIHLYYDQYYPIKYDRHGDPEGFNLYSVDEPIIEDMLVGVLLDAYNLLPYAGKKEKRQAVYNSVMKGLRGARSIKSPPGWPKTWNAYYPNEFSEFSEWESSGANPREILNEFATHGVKDLSYKLYEFIENRL